MDGDKIIFERLSNIRKLLIEYDTTKKKLGYLISAIKEFEDPNAVDSVAMVIAGYNKARHGRDCPQYKKMVFYREEIKSKQNEILKEFHEAERPEPALDPKYLKSLFEDVRRFL